MRTGAPETAAVVGAALAEDRTAGLALLVADATARADAGTLAVDVGAAEPHPAKRRAAPRMMAGDARFEFTRPLCRWGTAVRLRPTTQTRTLGAAEVFDYRQHDLASTGRQYDLIFDAVGKLSHHPLDEVVEANRYVESERKTGNVVLSIGVKARSA